MIAFVLLLVLPLAACRSFSGQLDCVCGTENIAVSPRITHSHEVKHHMQYPWMVYLEVDSIDDETISCTGSIINDRFILTAAHCLANDVRQIHAWLDIGIKKQQLRITEMDKRIAIKSYKIHEKYTSRSQHNDIAVIEVKERFRFNETFTPICLPDDKMTDSPVDNLLIAGWGMSDKTMSGWHVKVESDFLREADMDIVSEDECLKHYPFLNSRKGMCAAGNRDSSSICAGDSGAPLMTRIEGQIFQVGVASFGKKSCGISDTRPDVLERVKEQMGWIRENIEHVGLETGWCTA